MPNEYFDIIGVNAYEDEVSHEHRFLQILLILKVFFE